MAQIINITSEALQAKIRELLPSQQGFGEDLQASNVVLPIIDLTETASGSSVRQDLQTAFAFGSQNAFGFTNSTVVLANTPGFWRVFGCVTLSNNSSGVSAALNINLTDGLSTKTLIRYDSNAQTSTATEIQGYVTDFIVFLGTGESISGVATQKCEYHGSVRQIADANGTLINPSGFTPQ